jgi:hypothetical protein
MVLDTKSAKHRLLPEAATTKESCRGVDDTQSDDAFDGSRDNT